MTDLLYKDEVYAIIGAAMEVYNDLGPGFLESIYQEATEMEVNARGIPSRAIQEINIKYKGRPLKKFYYADLICDSKIIVEIKAMNKLTLREESQLINYLKATGLKVGALINFGLYPTLEWKRLIYTKESPSRPATRTLGEDSTDYQALISDD